MLCDTASDLLVICLLTKFDKNHLQTQMTNGIDVPQFLNPFITLFKSLSFKQNFMI